MKRAETYLFIGPFEWAIYGFLLDLLAQSKMHPTAKMSSELSRPRRTDGQQRFFPNQIGSWHRNGVFARVRPTRPRHFAGSAASVDETNGS
jgi:hypothetical protein